MRKAGSLTEHVPYRKWFFPEFEVSDLEIHELKRQIELLDELLAIHQVAEEWEEGRVTDFIAISVILAILRKTTGDGENEQQPGNAQGPEGHR